MTAYDPAYVDTLLARTSDLARDAEASWPEVWRLAEQLAEQLSAGRGRIADLKRNILSLETATHRLSQGATADAGRIVELQVGLRRALGMVTLSPVLRGQFDRLHKLLDGAK